MKVLKLALVGALGAIPFNTANAATVLILDQPHVTSDPAYTMTLTFEETSRVNEVKVTFKAVNVGTHYVDGLALNLPEGINYQPIQLGGVTAEEGFFQAPNMLKQRDNLIGPNQGNQGIFDIGAAFATGRNKPSNVLFTTGDSVSFLVTSTQGPLSVADIAETFDTPTDTWVAAASVVTAPGYCAWYTPESGTSIPEPSTALLGLLGLGALARRKR
jgi:MYXO-CTERM domain-containing protein